VRFWFILWLFLVFYWFRPAGTQTGDKPKINQNRAANPLTRSAKRQSLAFPGGPPAVFLGEFEEFFLLFSPVWDISEINRLIYRFRCVVLGSGGAKRPSKVTCSQTGGF